MVEKNPGKASKVQIDEKSAKQSLVNFHHIESDNEVEQVRPKFVVELPSEVTTTITAKVFDVFNQAQANARESKFPLYMSKKQACEYLNISNLTMNEWISSSDIPYKHIGKVYRFNRNELDKFMTSK